MELAEKKLISNTEKHEVKINCEPGHHTGKTQNTKLDSPPLRENQQPSCPYHKNV